MNNDDVHSDMHTYKASKGSHVLALFILWIRTCSPVSSLSCKKRSHTRGSTQSVLT